MTLDDRSFRYWSQLHHRWVTEAGGVELRVGVSSRDIRHTARIEIDGDGVPAEVDATSTLGEWLAHPAGSVLLKETGASAQYEQMSWEMRKIVEAMPISKLAALGLGMSRDQLDELTSAASTCEANR